MAEPVTVPRAVTNSPFPVRFLHRIELAASVIPPRIPAALAPHVSEERWSDFWATLHPLGCRVQRSATLQLRAHWFLFLLLLVAAIAVALTGVYLRHVHLSWERTARVAGTLFTFAATHIVLLTFTTWQGRTVQSQLQELEMLIRNYEERSSFQKDCRLAIECEATRFGIDLLITPVSPQSTANENRIGASDKIVDSSGVFWHDGYLRIRVSAHFFMWRPVSLPHFQTIAPPPEWHALSPTDEPLWEPFWNEISTASRRYQWARAAGFLGQWSLYVVCLQLVVPGSDYILAIWMLSMVIDVYATSQFCDIYAIIGKYKVDFAERGWRVEWHEGSYELCALGLYQMACIIVTPIPVSDVNPVRMVPAIV